MVEFILNKERIVTDEPKETLLLDFIRNKMNLTGTKSACREGDCGSCSVIIGTLYNDEMQYMAATSCLIPIGNIHGKHVVTVEGLNLDIPTKIQDALIQAAAIQCGYCTPGIILSLTAYMLSIPKISIEGAIESISGNICRCTGYQAILNSVHTLYKKHKGTKLKVEQLIKENFIPNYFENIKDLLSKIGKPNIDKENTFYIGGGTDLYVKGFCNSKINNSRLLTNEKDLSNIEVDDNKIIIGAATTITDFFNDEEIEKLILKSKRTRKLIASKLIRNIATIGGNLANASPIGDLSIILLALGAKLEIELSSNRRIIKLDEFFKTYKKTDLKKGEIIRNIIISKNNTNSLFNFEKVSKRQHLDIATVNSAISIQLENNKIDKIRLSFGGVAPIPLFTKATCNFLLGKSLSINSIVEAKEILLKEITPISDVRGSKEYKKLLTRQLFYAHFTELFPDIIKFKDLC